MTNIFFLRMSLRVASPEFALRVFVDWLTVTHPIKNSFHWTIKCGRPKRRVKLNVWMIASISKYFRRRVGEYYSKW